MGAEPSSVPPTEATVAVEEGGGEEGVEQRPQGPQGAATGKLRRREGGFFMELA